MSAGEPLLTVDGDLAFAAGAKVTLPDDVEDLLEEGVLLASATGAVSGTTPALEAPAFEGIWKLAMKNDGLRLTKKTGMMLIFH